jgi:predicted membrane-bound spermidine synthase
MNSSRCTFAAVASPDARYIYVLGGFDGNALRSVERYDSVSDSWENVENMNAQRYMHSAGICMIRSVDN